MKKFVLMTLIALITTVTATASVSAVGNLDSVSFAANREELSHGRSQHRYWAKDSFTTNNRKGRLTTLRALPNSLKVILVLFVDFGENRCQVRELLDIVSKQSFRSFNRNAHSLRKDTHSFTINIAIPHPEA